MGQSFSLGRISGIRIGVNWSVVVIVARRSGVQVEGITLWLLGGVSRLSQRVSTRAARAESLRGLR